MKKLILIVLVLTSFPLFSQDQKKGEFSVSIGHMFEGELYISDLGLYDEVGDAFLVHMQYDHYVAGKFAIGGYYTYGSPYLIGIKVTMHEFGIALRLRFDASEKITIKPGLNIGYRTFSEDFGSGMGLNMAIAFQYNLKAVKPYIQLGFLGQPAGGNDVTNITFVPTPVINFGITF